MSDMIDSLATHVGIDPETAKKGLGALLAFLKKEVGPDLFSKVEASLPDARGMISAFESDKDASGQGRGILDTVAGLAGKVLGGKTGAAADLLAVLSRLGISPEQIEAFLPKALELVRHHLPPEVLARIQGLLPPALASVLNPSQ